MTVSAPLLERVWFAASSDGRDHSFSVRVGAPIAQPEGDWKAAVTLEGVQNRTYEIDGIDSWQAVEQAMLHAARMLQHLESKGWRFYWDAAKSEAAVASELYRGVDP